MTFEITIKPSDHRFDCAADESILAAALQAGLLLPYGCRDGACGSCKSRIVSGEVVYGSHQPAILTDIEKRQGYVLPCVARPRSAVTLECREVRRAGDIRIRKLPVRIEKIELVAPDVAIVSLKLPANERLQFLAGQYVDILLKDGGRRSFSLATAPHDDGFLQLHMRQMPGGAFTQHLFRDLPVKEILRIEGPHGAFYLRETSDKPIVLVAGGTGFAPIKSVIEHAFHIDTEREMVLYWGARSLEDLYLAALPGQWQQAHPNFTFIPVLSEPQSQDNWPGRTGLVHQAVLDDFADLSAYQVYACGAPGMIQAARSDFTQLRRLPEEEFFADSFTSAVQPKVEPGSGPSPGRGANLSLAWRQENHSLGALPMNQKAFASQADLEEKPVSFVELGPGAYAYTAEGDPNTGIIVSDQGTFVIDTQATPVMAQDVINRIRNVTDVPVRYVVLSHYHAVRVLGASAYNAEFIIASQGTYELIVERGEQDMHSEIGRFPRLFRAVESVPGLTWPNIVFENKLVLHLTYKGKPRTVEIAHVGRGHTRGDTIVWLREDRILYSGDLVEYAATPYTGDAYLRDWPATLDRLEALQPVALVPGRGAALTTPEACKAGLDGTRDFIRMMYGSVEAGARAGKPLNAVYRETYDALKPKFGHWVIFDHCLPFDVTRAYDEATQYPDPRIWTAQRDIDMWKALEGQ